MLSRRSDQSSDNTGMKTTQVVENKAMSLMAYYLPHYTGDENCKNGLSIRFPAFSVGWR